MSKQFNNAADAENSTRTETDAAFEAGAFMASLNQLREGGPPFVVIPSGFQMRDVEEYLPRPLRKRSTVNMSSVDSFCRYINDFSDGETCRIFADKRGPALKAILDYHEAKGMASWCDDVVKLTLTLSKEWQTWNSGSGRALSQVAFAEFLEDNFLNIVEPDGATVLQAAGHLEAKKTVSFKSGVKLDNGSVQLSYEENVEGKGKGNLVIPSAFTLGIPVFENGDPVAVEARLRYRIKDDVLTFTYLLNNPQKVMDSAFDAVLTQVQAETGIAPYLGS